ncbi:MAG: HAMP domain-containing histidine kinase [Rhodothermales bacterium]|nr:HAMP domain-containing histidine kinase [Rhodothermales bacterium]
MTSSTDEMTTSQQYNKAPSFTNRLLYTIGVVMGIALVALSVLIWISIRAVMISNAFGVLEVETNEIAVEIATDRSTLDVNVYDWDEPHHRFIGPFVDPFFVQVFGTDRRLIRESANVLLLSSDYPDRLLADDSSQRGWLSELRTIVVNDLDLYYVTMPLRNEDGTLLGYLQVARENPGISTTMRRIGLILTAGTVLVMLVLGLLIWWQAVRVLRPLGQITRATETILPRQLNNRIPIPAGADRETVQLARTMNSQLEMLESSFEEMYRFTANAAHQLQTPLTILRGHVDVALRRPRTAEKYRETLVFVGQEIDSLTKTVRSLLALARLDRASEPLPGEIIDLGDLVTREVQRMQEVVAEKKLNLNLGVTEDVHVSGQPELLREVVSNLLDNAIKYTPAGTLDVRVSVEEGKAQIVVKDTGIGMTSMEVSRVTDRFFRAQSNLGETEGSGLGLALVSQIVARHGGEFRIDATKGAGTSVCICLPLADPDSA